MIKTLQRLMSRSLSRPSSLFLDAFGASKTMSGASVTEEGALKLISVWAAVRVLAESIASLPLNVYKDLPGGGKTKETGNRLYELLHNEPNEHMTSFDFREAMMGHVLLWGNAYALIERDSQRRVTALRPLLPNCITVEARARDGEADAIWYVDRNRGAAWPAADVLHIHGLSYDGLIGYSPIRVAREAVGVAFAAEQTVASFYGNDATPTGILEHPGELGEHGQKVIRDSWEDLHKGPAKSGRIAVLEEGMKWQQIGIPLRDAQFIESRRFQVTEIARLYRIPPHMLADLERASFSNIEQQSIDFVVHSLRPWLVRWEQEMRRKLFAPNPSQRGRFARFVVDGLLRGDTPSRFAAYATARQWGFMSANDILELEDRNPIEGGDVYYAPSNMVNAEKLAFVDEPTSESESESDTVEEDDAERIGRIRSSHGMLISDMFARLFRKESSAIQRAKSRSKGDRAAFDGRLLRFYAGYAVEIGEEIATQVMAAQNSIGQEPRGGEIGGEVGKRILADSAKAVADFGTLDQQLKTWPIERVATYTGQVLELIFRED